MWQQVRFKGGEQKSSHYGLYILGYTRAAMLKTKRYEREI